MAIIYTYPRKSTAEANDLVVISDSSDSNKTKQLTLQSIADYVDGEVTLQEVLNTGNTANNQSITLTGTGGGGSNISIAGDLTAVDITASGLSTLTTVDINGGNIDGTTIGASVVADGSFDTMTAATVDINGGNIDSTIIGASSPANGTFATMTADTVNIDGGNIDNTRIGISQASDGKFVTVSGSSAIQVVGNLTGAAALRVLQGPIQFGNTGGTGYGNVGDVIISNGSAGTPEWIAQSSLSVENLIETVENNTSSPIAKGTPIHIAANPSGTPRVEPADASVPSTMPASGLAYEAIPAGVGQSGQMIIAGQIEGIDTAAFSVGSVVYVDAGGGIGVRPVGATTRIQNVGIVTKSGGGVAGILQVTATGRSNDLPNNDANALFAASSTGTPISTTGKFEVNVSGNSMLIGDGSGNTDITMRSNEFRAEVINNTIAGQNNFIIGQGALAQAYANGGTGQGNTALGLNSMSGNSASGAMAANYNVAVGQNTLASGTGLSGTVIYNTALGYRAMAGTGAGPTTYNTAIGANSLENINSSPLATFGDLNTAVGSSSLFNLNNGEENVALGSSAGTGVTTGDKNVFIGAQANTVTANVTETTTIGYNADSSANKGTALGAESDVTGVGGVALGWGAQAAGGRLNIKVDGGAGPTPFGGLPQTPVAGPIPPAGLVAGDVYVITGVTLPGAPGPANVLAIV